MKIVIIANGYPDKREPQWGCFERDQAVALTGQGHQVSILYVDRRFRTYWRKIGITHRSEHGIEVCGIFLFPFFNFAKISHRLHFKVVSKMLDCVYRSLVKKTGKPDVIYAHYVYNIAFATFLQQKYNIPLVGIEHWSELTKPVLSPIAQYWGNIAYHRADRLLAVSESLARHIYNHFGKEATIVYDMVGQEFVSNEIKESPKKEFLFIAIGSLIHRKGYDVLIEAFEKSCLAQEGCRVTIVGSGSEKMKLQQKIESFGLSESVSLVGRKTKEEIIDYLSKSHVFVLSSRSETFGVVCIEAMSQGLPNIATVCGGPEEFINGKTGVLVPPDDIEAMSKAMREMFENYSVYDKNYIAETCRQKFAPMVIAKQLETIFFEVIS